MRSTVKFSGVLIWGSTSSAGVSPLCFLKSIVNVALPTSADKLYEYTDFQ